MIAMPVVVRTAVSPCGRAFALFTEKTSRKIKMARNREEVRRGGIQRRRGSGSSEGGEGKE